MGETRGILKKHWILNDTLRFSAKQKEQLAHIADVDKLYTLPEHSDFLLLVRPDGSFNHHSHIRGHNVWGVSHITYLTKDPELIAWCKRVLDFYLSRGTDYGWIPESLTYPICSETCAVADVIDIALNLAKCGYPEYYDTAGHYDGLSDM